MNDLQPHTAEAPKSKKRTRRSGTSATPRSAKPGRNRSRDTAILLDQSGDWMPAEELREALLATAAAGDGIAVNFGTLSHLETASLQVLLSASKSMRLQLESINEALQAGMRAAGVWAVLQAGQEAECTTR